MSAPEVTVIVPTRDRPGMLASSVGSVLAQRDVDLDIVIVDDGSSPEHAAAIAALTGDRVRVLRNATSGGVGAARNRGVEATRAPWVAFCDDDDLWTPTKLAGQLDAARSTDRGWAYTGAVKFETGPTIWQLMPPPSPDEVHAGLPWKNLIPAGASNVLVHREPFLAVGGFDGRLAHLADWDLWLRLRETGLPAAAPGIGVGYRMHTGAMSLDPEGILDDLRVIDRRWRSARGGAPLDPGPTHLWIAMSWLRGGHRLAAAGAYLRAVPHDRRRAVRGLLRTAVPVPPRPAHVVAGSADATRIRRGARVVELPADVEDVLGRYATSSATPTAAS